MATILGSGILIGCQKSIEDNSDATETENTMEATQDDAIADNIFGDIGEQIAGADADAGIGQIDLFGSANPNINGEPNLDITTDPPNGNRCFSIAIIPLNPAVFPKTITIDYGNGCLGRDGRFRKGKIITVHSKPLVQPGAQAVTTFDGYYVDSVKVEGRHVTRNNSTNDVLIFTRLVQNGKLTKPNGNFILWNAEHTQKQVAGLGTPRFPRDDEWMTTGGARGENKFGNRSVSWTRTIMTPLHKAASCRWIDKGIVKITRNDKNSILNFGDGTCDNKATVTINGITKDIRL